MSEEKISFVTTVKSFPSAFWVANTMEIFERMAWYGFYAASALYLTGPVETGGLGFTDLERGQIIAIVPFFLYMFPVFTGALADRYGYKKMFIIAYLGMIVSYYLLGEARGFWSFMGAFMCVAVSAAIFKPVVVGTVARVTNGGNSAMGFGIFYMMVNIGGFFGPLVAGVVRGVSWKYVFWACSGWATVNLIIALVFYREPMMEGGAGKTRSLKKVLDDMVEVLGNLRFFIAVFGALLALVLANFDFLWFQFWPDFVIFLAVWVLANFLYDAILPAGSGLPVGEGGVARSPLLKRMHCGNWRFAVFLLIMSGFWTSFIQIFITLPLYVRDFVDTSPMVNVGRSVFDSIGKSSWIDGLASIEETELLIEFDRSARRAHGVDLLPQPEKKKTDDPNQLAYDLHNLRIDCSKTLKKSKLIDSERSALEGLVTKIESADPKDKTVALVVLDEGETTVADVKREIRRRKLPTDPGLTAKDLTVLASAVEQLNLKGAENPLTVLDIVDSSRKILQYKVRIRPTRLAELLLAIPDSAPEITDDMLDTAVKMVNNRLDDKKIPEFKGDEADVLREALRSLVKAGGTFVTPEAVIATSKSLTTKERNVEPAMVALGVRDLVYRPYIWKDMDEGRQVNPEHIVNVDALSIVLFQILISFIMARFHQFTTMIIGMLIAAVGVGLPALAGGSMIGPLGGSLIIVLAGIFTFAIGEMMASPTSQEYVGRIAPKEKVALYMGYYFVAVALGNLFGGVLSGQLYGKLATDMQRPDLMWLVFGLLMVATAVVFLLYDRFALPRNKANTVLPGAA